MFPGFAMFFGLFLMFGPFKEGRNGEYLFFWGLLKQNQAEELWVLEEVRVGKLMPGAFQRLYHVTQKPTGPVGYWNMAHKCRRFSGG